ncbi:MAG: hypothetical protein ACI9R3_001210 [Verrucomicrobiales bacterium]|jgi:hypothetical protein
MKQTRSQDKLAARAGTGLALAAVFLAGGTRLQADTEVVQEAFLKASNAVTNGILHADWFGWSMAMDADTLVVGAWDEESAATGVNGNGDDNSADCAGAAYVFVRRGQGWVEEAYLKASNTEAGDRFGVSVAVSRDTVVVGAPQKRTSGNGWTGPAYVFVRENGTWRQQAILEASNSDPDDAFGRSVAIDGDTIVVGAPREYSGASGPGANEFDNSLKWAGAAYVFVRNGDTWVQQAYLKSSRPGRGFAFGGAVAIDGNTIVAGSEQEDRPGAGSLDNLGAAYVFVRGGDQWRQQARLTASVDTGEFGRAVDIDEDTIVVGATGTSGGRSTGAFVFVRTARAWTEQAHLISSNYEDRDTFGSDVAVSGNAVVVGAPGEDSASKGINGDEIDNRLAGSGAAYLFTREGTSWTQQAYVKASNPGQGDQFGQTVAASRDRFAVGAGWEGDQSGAAYTFHATGIPTFNEYALGGGDLDISVNGNSVAVSYRRRRDPEAAGLVYQVETSPDLQEWSPAEVSEEEVNLIDATWEKVTVILGVDPGASELFARIRVSQG